MAQLEKKFGNHSTSSSDQESKLKIHSDLKYSHDVPNHNHTMTINIIHPNERYLFLCFISWFWRGQEKVASRYISLANLAQEKGWFKDSGTRKTDNECKQEVLKEVTVVADIYHAKTRSTENNPTNRYTPHLFANGIFQLKSVCTCCFCVPWTSEIYNVPSVVRYYFPLLPWDDLTTLDGLGIGKHKQHTTRSLNTNSTPVFFALKLSPFQPVMPISHVKMC